MLSSFLVVLLTVSAARAQDHIALLAQGRYRDAAAALDALVQAKPKDAALRGDRCTARFKLADWDGAIADCTEAVRLQPKLKRALARQLSDAYERRGRARVEGGDPTGVKDLLSAVRADRKNAAPYAALGAEAQRRGEDAKAMDYLDRAILLDPSAAGAFAARARAAAALKRRAQASRDAKRAVELDAALAPALRDLLP